MQPVILNAAADAAEAIAAQLVAIPGGCFRQGSGAAEIADCMAEWAGRLVEAQFTPALFRRWLLKECPAHDVNVAPFHLMKYPVTNAQFAAYVCETGATPPESLLQEAPDDHPVWGLTLPEVQRFIAWLNYWSERRYRLPTESEWEYAARGPRGLAYPFGERFDPHCCNTVESGIGGTTAVDRYARYASGFGICDMAGNVEEWTADCYAPYPGGLRIDDDLSARLGPLYPVTRGGSFHRGGDLARCARRHGPFPSPDYKYIGFRLAITSDSFL